MVFPSDSKVSVTKPSAALWCEVLFAECVMVPEWEVGKSHDIAELLSKGLVKVTNGSPSKLLVLVDQSMKLDLETKKVLLIVRMSKREPIAVNDLITRAKHVGVQIGRAHV